VVEQLEALSSNSRTAKQTKTQCARDWQGRRVCTWKSQPRPGDGEESKTMTTITVTAVSIH
jgi:hypothetical protein